ncbi:hypothetical protein Patl1_14435 [Pistacia atlantica]|uniref:Uncharacterized protein n=1 Tax=Pistacia atlantica TaxID=434234 RepID=A0ACC1AXZ7_9ROSI|nr:hypothetical protein Patl1_14435 [Pistacia atlantica]
MPLFENEIDVGPRQMAGRGRITAFEGRTQTPGMLRHGPFPGRRSLEPLPPPGLLEDKIAVQAAEIEQLAGDNHRLAASHVSLRQELAAAQQEIPRLKAHIRSIHAESDIQIRVLLSKIAKMEDNIRAGESVKKDLQQAHIEAQNLVRARQELTVKLQEVSQELQRARLDVKSLPDLHAELDSLRQEHQRLRATFEYEKGKNIEKVEQLKAMEKDLIGMAREMEKLKAEVMNAEMTVHAPIPYTGGYMNHSHSYPPPVQGSAIYVNGYGQAVVHMGVVPTIEGTIPHGSGNEVAASSVVGVAAVPATSGGAVWGGPYDPSLARR